MLYLSDFFERNRAHYYDNLMRVRTQGDLAQWLRSFLVGVVETAQTGSATLRIAGVSAAPAYKLVADLERLGILKEITGGRRGRTYVFDEYVRLFR